jgi:hypothetical protein
VLTVVLTPAENLELMAVKWVMRTHHCHPLRVAAIRVLMMGIVSWFLLMP